MHRARGVRNSGILGEKTRNESYDEPAADWTPNFGSRNDSHLHPAACGCWLQAICTWCVKRLDIDRFVSRDAGEEITLQAKLCTTGKGRSRLVDPVSQPMEMLPFTFKVGTATVARPFGWDLRPHLCLLSTEAVDFWKCLKARKKKGTKKIKISPRDLVAAAIDQVHIHGIRADRRLVWSWKALLLKPFPL